MQAHYAERISQDLFEEETARIARERATALATTKSLETPHHEAMQQLDLALELLDDVQRAYLHADDQGKRLFNQAIFERIWVSRETVAGVEYTEPYHEILSSEGRSGRPRAPP